MTRVIGWTFLLACFVVTATLKEPSITDAILLAGWFIVGAILAK